MSDIKCDLCGHYESSHDPKCGALDAAGDTCDCTGPSASEGERVEQLLRDSRNTIHNLIDALCYRLPDADSTIAEARIVEDRIIARLVPKKGGADHE